MEWEQVEANWAAFVDVMDARWPRAERAELIAIGGDRDRFETYISELHDLTRAEVREDMESLLLGETPEARVSRTNEAR